MRSIDQAPDAIPPGEPDPPTIANACRAIRRGWTRAERYRRLVVKPRGWRPPVLGESDLELAPTWEAQGLPDA